MPKLQRLKRRPLAFPDPLSSRAPRLRYSVLLTFIVIAVIVVIAAMIFYPLQSIQVSDNSMEPTLKYGQEIEIDTAYFRSNPIERGDIVAFSLKTLDNPLIKRIIALQGDRLEFREGIMLVNSQEVHETYLGEQAPKFTEQDLGVIALQLRSYNGFVPHGSVFALNDNWAAGRDSRDLGFFPVSQIIGKVIVQKTEG